MNIGYLWRVELREWGRGGKGLLLLFGEIFFFFTMYITFKMGQLVGKNIRKDTE